MNCPAWWLSGWQRAWRESPKEHSQLWRRLLAAEDRYQRENGFGKYATVKEAE